MKPANPIFFSKKQRPDKIAENRVILVRYATCFPCSAAKGIKKWLETIVSSHLRQSRNQTMKYRIRGMHRMYITQ